LVDKTVSIPCPICLSSSDSTLSFFRGFRIAGCANCEFILVNPRPTQESLCKLYSNQKQNPFFADDFEPLEYEQPVLSKIIRQIQEYVPTGALLEVGCGRGDLLKLAQKSGFSATGCDLFGGEVPESDGIIFYDSTVKEAQIPDNTFDIVVMRNILEHLFDPNMEIGDIGRILRPNGYLYLKVPNVQFEHGLLCQFVFGKKHKFDPPYHLNHFSPTSLQTFLKGAQFEFVSWCLEQPTFYANRKLNLKRQIGYRLIQTIYVLSRGRIFPKITLSCVARKRNTHKHTVFNPPSTSQ